MELGETEGTVRATLEVPTEDVKFRQRLFDYECSTDGKKEGYDGHKGTVWGGK